MTILMILMTGDIGQLPICGKITRALLAHQIFLSGTRHKIEQELEMEKVVQ
jgi:hypothetical protein